MNIEQQLRTTRVSSSVLSEQHKADARARTVLSPETVDELENLYVVSTHPIICLSPNS